MGLQIELGDLTIEVVLKDIRNIHLSVYPPDGRVHISAPLRTDLDTLRVFAISKLIWIKQQQQKFQEQPRETPREYLDRESHYLWGKRYLLKLIENDQAPTLELQHNQILLSVRPGTPEPRKQAILEEWYRRQIRQALPPLLAQWEPRLGVKVEQVFIQRMKTRWGSCTPDAARIRLNTELAKKPPECLEYIVVHELIHLLEPTHNPYFVALLDQYLPNWRLLRDELNRAPLGHETWGY
jgi:predicted metal-dependent hydrolase